MILISGILIGIFLTEKRLGLMCNLIIIGKGDGIGVPDLDVFFGALALS